MQTNEKYLPIGTVVLLKEGKKRLMIIGFRPIADDETKRLFDYSACLYPEGIISSSQVAMFNHEDIDKIFFYGYRDEEEAVFKQELKKFLENSNLQEKENQVNTENTAQ